MVRYRILPKNVFVSVYEILRGGLLSWGSFLGPEDGIRRICHLEILLGVTTSQFSLTPRTVVSTRLPENGSRTC